MRTIKFRGMDIQGRWFIGNLAIVPDNNRLHKPGHYISNSAGMPFAYQVRPETVGQYTGLHDKNGKEIYEGDIIASKSYGGQSMVIKWSDDPENHGWYCHDVKGGDEDHLNMLEAVECEVIGNEYEHPHLLEEESA